MNMTFKIAATCAAAQLVAGGSAMAETVMRFSDFLPTTHYLTVVGSQPFMDAVTEATGGEIKFEHFPAQQLGKSSDFVRLTQGGLAQISVVGVSFVADKMELSNVAQMPSIVVSACDGLAAYNSILDTTPLRQKDFTDNGVKLLMTYMLPPFEIATSKAPVDTLEDLKGLKLLVASRTTELLVNKLGGAGVQATSGAQAYEDLTRGTVDGVIFAPDSQLTYDLPSITEYGTTNGNFGGQDVAVIMNQKAFDDLDDETKAVFEKIAKETEERVCAYVDQKKSEALAKIAEGGNTLTTYTDAQLAELNKAAAEVADEWAADADSRGLSGSETLNAFRAALAK